MSESAKHLKTEVFELVAGYKQHLQAQGDANLAALEGRVEAYCKAVAALPKEEGRVHEADLQLLMREITQLGDALKTAQEKVRVELAGLGRVRQANTAYKKSDSIGTVHRKKEAE